MPEQERPGEPEWPEWVRRRDEHDLVEVGRGVCACRWLEKSLEDLSLFGGVVWSCFRCIDCGAVWEQKT